MGVNKHVTLLLWLSMFGVNVYTSVHLYSCNKCDTIYRPSDTDDNNNAPFIADNDSDENEAMALLILYQNTLKGVLDVARIKQPPVFKGRDFVIVNINFSYTVTCMKQLLAFKCCFNFDP